MPNSYGPATSFSGNANGLANGNFASLGAIDFGAAPPHECFVEVSVQASAATSGNRQVVVWVRSSVDGTNFSVAPSSADSVNARLVGVVSLPDTTARRSIAIPLSPLFGGALPPEVEVYVQNDCGVALAASGQVGQYRTETFG
jgi:hypothetical protein